MTDSRFPDLPGGETEQQLWNALGDAELEPPSARLRQEFYKRLEESSRPGISDRLQAVLGFSGNAGWLTAAVCALLGWSLGTGIPVSAPSDANGHRLEVLEENVSMLHRSLVLDRLQNDQPGKRLRGVMDAAQLAHDDTVIADKLLDLATSDQVHSIRSAAIESLAPQLNTPAIGAQLMSMLRTTESPFVQLALIDLVLRNGSDEQVDKLLTLANDNQLYPDLQRHVLTTLERT